MIAALLALPLFVPAPVPAAAGAQTCRALVDVRTPGGFRVADVRFAPEAVAVTDAPGLVARADDRTYALVTTAGEHSARSKFGSATSSWVDVVARLLPAAPGTGPGPAVSLVAGGPPLEPPDAEFGGGMMDWDSTQTASIEAIVGPYVFLSKAEGGYAGGAHGFDGETALTVNVADGKPVNLGALLGADLRAPVKAALKAADTSRRSEVGDDVEALPAPDLGHAALRFDPAARGGVTLFSVLECCSWAENHNLYPLDVPLPRFPKALAAYDGLDNGGAHRSPTGCGTVDVAGGKLKVTPAMAATSKTRAPVVVALGEAVQAIVGVHWIPAADAFDVTQLPAPVAGPAGKGAKPLIADARKRVQAKDLSGAIALFTEAVEKTPEGPARAPVLAELGYARFLMGDLPGAKRDAEAALAAAAPTDAAVRGMILYNLGRVAEAQSDAAEARRQYEASLALRPNKVVAKRLAALPKGP